MILALSGCVQRLEPSMDAGSPADHCPVVGNGHWQAWLESAPVTDPRPMLNITGEVELPTPGYIVALRAGSADRAMPPSQRFEFIATPPGGLAAQVVSRTSVAYRETATYPAYRSIVIVCGKRSLTTIKQIRT